MKFKPLLLKCTILLIVISCNKIEKDSPPFDLADFLTGLSYPDSLRQKLIKSHFTNSKNYYIETFEITRDEWEFSHTRDLLNLETYIIIIEHYVDLSNPWIKRVKDWDNYPWIRIVYKVNSKEFPKYCDRFYNEVKVSFPIEVLNKDGKGLIKQSLRYTRETDKTSIDYRVQDDFLIFDFKLTRVE